MAGADVRIFRDPEENMNTAAAAADARYPASPPPLSDRDAYTSWPGGVDPSVRVYDSVGGRRRRRATHRNRKASCGGSRRHRGGSRRHRRASRRHRKA